MPPSSTHAQQTAAFYAEHRRRLHDLVTHRVIGIDAHTLEDACSHAWTQLLRHPHIDVTQSPGRTLGWLTTTAEREAWRLQRRQRRETATADDAALEAIAATRAAAPSSEDLALLHERLDLVRQVPERPRRFLLRLMVGYSYDEITAQEQTSYRVVNRQVARAKRLLRHIEERHNDASHGGEHAPPGG